MSRTPYRAVATFLVAAILFMSGQPQAKATEHFAVAGSLAFDGTLTIEGFPCAPTCHAMLSGFWTGHLEGVSGSQHFEISWVRPRPILDEDPDNSFTLGFDETSCGTGDGWIGIGSGDGTGHAGPGFALGFWKDLADTDAKLPRSINAIDGTFGITTTRVGNALSMELNPFTLTLDVFGMDPLVVLADAAPGAAILVVADVPSCDSPQTDIEVPASGAVEFEATPAVP